MFLSQYLIIRVYVNDLLIMGESQKDINHLKKALTSHFKMTDLEPVTYYFRLCIIRNIIINTIFFS